MRFRAALLPVLLLIAQLCWAQGTAKERVFSQSVPEVQAALKKLSGGVSGRLPVLDGFVAAPTGTLDHYQRPYYQCSVRVAAAPSGNASTGSVVRVAAKITAWNVDPAHSGYEVLQSNGRLETDLLDRLQDALATNGTPGSRTSSKQGRTVATKPEISAPMPQFPKHSGTTTAPGTTGLVSQNPILEQEAKNLEEILRSQSHPTNLVAVKQNQTPLRQNPSSDAKVLFLASAEDEFELLDVNPEWVHVRVSGLSRGWLRKSAVEILDGTESTTSERTAIKEGPPVTESSQATPPFSISSEEVGSFPGNWAPLKGKNVKIISVQQAPGTGRITSPADKLRFAESVLKKENLFTPGPAEGLVLIFDAEDGGMVASTRAALERLKKGTISEQAFWKECFLDPSEILGSPN